MVAGYHSVFSVEAKKGLYTMIGVTCTISFEKTQNKQCVFTLNDPGSAPIQEYIRLSVESLSCWTEKKQGHAKRENHRNHDPDIASDLRTASDLITFLSRPSPEWSGGYPAHLLVRKVVSSILVTRICVFPSVAESVRTRVSKMQPLVDELQEC